MQRINSVVPMAAGTPPSVPLVGLGRTYLKAVQKQWKVKKLQWKVKERQ